MTTDIDDDVLAGAMPAVVDQAVAWMHALA